MGYSYLLAYWSASFPWFSASHSYLIPYWSVLFSSPDSQLVSSARLSWFPICQFCHPHLIPYWSVLPSSPDSLLVSLPHLISYCICRPHLKYYWRKFVIDFPNATVANCPLLSVKIDWLYTVPLSAHYSLLVSNPSLIPYWSIILPPESLLFLNPRLIPYWPIIPLSWIPINP